jgi:hypothetical protein
MDIGYNVNIFFVILYVELYIMIDMSMPQEYIWVMAISYMIRSAIHIDLLNISFRSMGPSRN